MIEMISEQTAKTELQLVANTINELRKVDVDRLLCSSSKPVALAVWIATNRPDLEQECRDILIEEDYVKTFNVGALRARMELACSCGAEEGDDYTKGCQDPNGCFYFVSGMAENDQDMLTAHLQGLVSEEDCPVCLSNEPDMSELSSPAGSASHAPEPSTVAPHGSQEPISPESDSIENDEARAASTDAVVAYIPMKSIKTQRQRAALAQLMETATVFTRGDASSGWVLLYPSSAEFAAASPIADSAAIPFNGMPQFQKDIQL